MFWLFDSVLPGGCFWVCPLHLSGLGFMVMISCILAVLDFLVGVASGAFLRFGCLCCRCCVLDWWLLWWVLVYLSSCEYRVIGFGWLV